MKAVTTPRASRHLSVVPPKDVPAKRLTRAQVAARLGISISTVRRFEGARLHPHVDENDVRWFDEQAVAALAAQLANEPRVRRGRNAQAAGAPTRSLADRGELAAQVFERLEQRQSLAEIVVGVRVEPQVVRGLFEEWCLGLTEGQLQMAREPRVPREHEVAHANPAALAARLAVLPHGELTRISVGRFRSGFMHGDYEYARVTELGGFHVSGPCALDDITRRFGPGDYRITAYGFDPPALRWEVLVEEVAA